MKRHGWVWAMCTGALLVLPTLAAGQELEAGVRLGVGITTLVGDDAEDPDSRNRFVGGIYGTIPVTDRFSVQPELLFAQKGASYPDSLDSSAFDAKLSLDYLEIPVLARISLTPEGSRSRTRFHLLVGPSFSIETKCEVEGSFEGVKLTVDCNDEDVGLETRSLDFGGVAGLSMEFPMGGTMLGLDARYTGGFTSIDDSDADEDIRNQVFSFGASLSFPFRF